MQTSKSESSGTSENLRKRIAGSPSKRTENEPASMSAEPGTTKQTTFTFFEFDNTKPADDQSDAATSQAVPVKPADNRSIDRGTYWLTRIVLLRYLGFIYCELDLIIDTSVHASAMPMVPADLCILVLWYLLS